MIVYRSPYRLRVQPAQRDPFEGPLRVALGRLRARRATVTLPPVGISTPAAAPDPCRSVDAREAGTR